MIAETAFSLSHTPWYTLPHPSYSTDTCWSTCHIANGTVKKSLLLTLCSWQRICKLVTDRMYSQATVHAAALGGSQSHNLPQDGRVCWLGSASHTL